MENPRTAISALYLADEDTLSDVLIGKGSLLPGERHAVDYFARDLVQRIRAGGRNRNLVNSFTQEYDLASKEGLALLCMAETMSRISDKATADQLEFVTSCETVIGEAISVIRIRSRSTASVTS